MRLTSPPKKSCKEAIGQRTRHRSKLSSRLGQFVHRRTTTGSSPSAVQKSNQDLTDDQHRMIAQTDLFNANKQGLLYTYLSLYLFPSRNGTVCMVY